MDEIPTEILGLYLQPPEAVTIETTSMIVPENHEAFVLCLPGSRNPSTGKIHMRSGYYFTDDAQEWADENMVGKCYVIGETLASAWGNRQIEVVFTVEDDMFLFKMRWG